MRSIYHTQVIGDDTAALDSVLKADVWRDHLLKEEALLNAKLAELEREGDDKRFEDAREEAATRLAEVHARLSDMDAESGPSRAAALLAGELKQVVSKRTDVMLFLSGLGFSEADQGKPTKSFSGGWRWVSLSRFGRNVVYSVLLSMRLALARALFVKV